MHPVWQPHHRAFSSVASLEFAAMVTVIQGKLAVGVLVAALVLMSSVRAEEDASLPEFMVFGQPYKVVGCSVLVPADDGSVDMANIQCML